MMCDEGGSSGREKKGERRRAGQREQRPKSADVER